MTDTVPPVLLSREGAVSWIRLNRPTVLNALDEGMAAAFRDACRSVAEEGPGGPTRVLVIAGNGRGFLAGGDVSRFNDDPAAAPEVVTTIIDSLHEALRILDKLDVPVLASVHGPVAGAGMSLACAADLCIAADDAKFTTAYARIGATPDGSGTYNLPRLVGLRRAMELAMLADIVGADEALRLGIVNKVVPAAALAEETRALAERLAAGPTVSYAGIRHLLRQSWTASLDQQLDAERARFRATAGTEDFREGIAAFLAKRKPVFRGR
ncbi:enoyl-CoA hydratase/isomerase family protein [Azospirillum doebereinerae]